VVAHTAQVIDELNEHRVGRDAVAER
jgi:hypothetical protein